MCLCQVSLWSRWIPRYFTSSAWGKYSLFNLTGGHVILLRVKVTCTDFASFAFILHVFNHDWILFRCIYSLCAAILGSSWTVRIAVSYHGNKKKKDHEMWCGYRKLEDCFYLTMFVDSTLMSWFYFSVTT